MGPALTKDTERKNQIALPDKTTLELNVSENLKLKFEYKNQIAPGSTEHELNVKEHVNLDHMKHTNIGLVWMEACQACLGQASNPGPRPSKRLRSLPGVAGS